MSEIRQIFYIAGYNFRRWRRNPRIGITFTLAFILCLMLSDKVVSFAQDYGTILQVTEVFIWTFGDANSIMISTLLLIVLFADMPFITTETPYLLYRVKIRTWIWGQIIYVIIATLIYVLFLLIVTCLICAPDSFAGNQWSDTAALLGYSGVGSKIAIPASVKAMEHTYPYQCTGIIFLMVLFYTMLVSTFMMLINLLKKGSWGIAGAFGVNIYGLLLNPEIFKKVLHLQSAMEYKANLAVGWLSPLNHATYYMHSFGYDKLPKVWMSFVIFLFIIAVNIWLLCRRMKKYEFDFLQTEE